MSGAVATPGARALRPTGDAAYLAGLLAWAQSLAHDIEAPDVVRLFAEDGARARQILLVRR